MVPEIRVLQVDDDVFRDRSASALEEAGLDVVTAADAASGLDRLDPAIDCVVSEYDVPGRDGLGFFRAVRERRPDLPVVLLTGRGGEAVASEAIGAGVADYLRKGAGGGRFDALVASIEDAVSEQREAAGVAESERMLSTLVSNLPGIVYRCRNAETWPMEYLGGNLEDITGYEADTLELVADVTDTEFPDADGGRRVCLSGHGSRSIDGTVPGRVFDGGERYVVSGADPEGWLADAPFDSGACLPLGDHGVFAVGARESDAFEETDTQLATVLAANAEAALDRAEKGVELRRERDDLAALFENIPDPTAEVVMRDAEPIVKRVNPAFEATFGHRTAAIAGENLDEYVVPDNAETDVKAYNQRLQRGLSLHDEVQRVTVDGIRDFILHIVPHDVDRETARGYAIYTDITDRKRRERELEGQNERLDEFASVVSHDLRNPLGVARGHLELARTADEEGLTAHLDSIEDAHERMEQLIQRLLAFARQGDPATTPTEVSLEPVARDAWGTVETGSLSIVVEGDAEVTADRDRLRQLLENLLRNSVEHGSTGSRAQPDDATEPADTATEVRVGPLDGGFYVEDDGPGIPEADREVVLDSGYSGGDGTGFGLSIVETIAEAHGWDLGIVDGKDGGARFEFRVEGASCHGS